MSEKDILARLAELRDQLAKKPSRGFLWAVLAALLVVQLALAAGLLFAILKVSPLPQPMQLLE